MNAMCLPFGENLGEASFAVPGVSLRADLGTPTVASQREATMFDWDFLRTQN